MSLLLGLFLLPLGCSDPAGVEYRGETLTAIDMHLHSGEWSMIPPNVQRYLSEKFPFPLSMIPENVAEQALSAESIADQLDSAGFTQGLLFAVYAPHSVGIATNEMVLKTITKAPKRFLGMASLRVDQWEEQQEAELAALDEALQKDEFIGIKLAHAHMHFRMDDPDYFGIYEVAAQNQAPVYIHTGISPFPGTMDTPPYTDPIYLEEAIATYPDVRFILGHMGYDFSSQQLGTFETCLDLAKKYENVYLEPSALGSTTSDPTGENYAEILTAIKEAGLIDRVIYGSDGPQYPGFLRNYAAQSRIAMTAADYSVDDAQKFLSENFETVFGRAE